MKSLGFQFHRRIGVDGALLYLLSTKFWSPHNQMISAVYVVMMISNV